MENERAKLELFLECYMQLDEQYQKQAEQMLYECTENRQAEPGRSGGFEPPVAAGS